jgi:cell division septum initiation protein DivIVA
MNAVPIVLLLSIACCGSVASASADEVQAAACKAAADARQQAADLRYEWTTIGPLLKAAEVAQDAGDFSKALALCAEAHRQAEQAIDQAHREAKNWRDAIVWQQ